MQSSRFEGTGVALITPFKDDNTIDFQGLKRLLNHLISNGVDYLVVNGTTGESVTTTQEEKKELLDFIIKENNKRLPIVYGIGGNNTAEIVRRLEEKDFEGIDALLSVSPYYNKPSQEGIYQHYKAIAAATTLPVMLYNVPGRTGSNIQAKTVVRLSKISNIIGVKEASGDLIQTMEIIKNVPEDFLVISGDDLLTVPIISVGGKGVISVIANAFPSEFSSMVKHALNGNFNNAAKLLMPLLDINPYLYEEGNPVGIKQVLEELEICKSNVRLPLAKASADLAAKIKSVMPVIK